MARVTSTDGGVWSHVRPFFGLAVTLSAGWLLFTLGFSAGWLVGPLVAAAAHNLLFARPWVFPLWLRRVGEVLLGVAVASVFTADIAVFVLHHAGPILIPAAGALMAGLVSAWVLHRQAGLDPQTAVYATAVGGAAEMISLAHHDKADDRIVASYHSVRIGIVTTLVSLILAAMHLVSPHAPAAAPLFVWQWSEVGRSVPVWLIGLTGITLARRFRVPGAVLVGAILPIVGLKSLGVPLHSPPPLFRYVAQGIIGAAIGSTFVRATVQQLRRTLKLQLANLGLLLLFSAGWAYVLWVSTGMLPSTAVLSAMPAGASDMAVIALTVGADASVVASIHTVRILTVSITAPLFARLLARGPGSRPARG